MGRMRGPAVMEYELHSPHTHTHTHIEFRAQPRESVCMGATVMHHNGASMQLTWSLHTKPDELLCLCPHTHRQCAVLHTVQQDAQCGRCAATVLSHEGAHTTGDVAVPATRERGKHVKSAPAQVRTVQAKDGRFSLAETRS